jgi:hypothetical protein
VSSFSLWIRSHTICQKTAGMHTRVWDGFYRLARKGLGMVHFFFTLFYLVLPCSTLFFCRFTMFGRTPGRQRDRKNKQPIARNGMARILICTYYSWTKAVRIWTGGVLCPFSLPPMQMAGLMSSSSGADCSGSRLQNGCIFIVFDLTMP